MHDREELLARVVSAVADRKGISEDELPPLYDSIEPDALEELFDHATTVADTELLVQFPYAGQMVTIQGQADISIEPTDSVSGSDIAKHD